MIGIGAMSVERFIFIHSTFLNMTEDDNDSLAGSGHSYDSGDDGQLYCNHWSCLNDFIFAVVVLVNWCKPMQLYSEMIVQFYKCYMLSVQILVPIHDDNCWGVL